MERRFFSVETPDENKVHNFWKDGIRPVLDERPEVFKNISCGELCYHDGDRLSMSFCLEAHNGGENGPMVHRLRGQLDLSSDPSSRLEVKIVELCEGDANDQEKTPIRAYEGLLRSQLAHIQNF